MSKQNQNQYFFRFHVITDALSHRKNGKTQPPNRNETDARTVAAAETGEGDEEGDSPWPQIKPPKFSWIVRIR